MGLLGEAAVAMWWNVADDYLAEFHEWHSKEHLPERLGIPGFNRGSRWQQEGSGEFFVIYELAAYDVLVSEGYRARLNAPTPWSQQMMPRHRDMVRSQCRVIASYGRGVAPYMCPIRLSPKEGAGGQLEAHLRAELARLSERAGVTGAHLLRTDTPASAMTTEQQIRGGDAVADWIALLTGHDRSALADVCGSVFDLSRLTANGASSVSHGEPYSLVHAMVPQDV